MAGFFVAPKPPAVQVAAPAPEPAPAPVPPPLPAPVYTAPAMVPVEPPPPLVLPDLPAVPAAIDGATTAETSHSRRTRGLAGTMATSWRGAGGTEALLPALVADGLGSGTLSSNALAVRRKSLLGE